MPESRPAVVDSLIQGFIRTFGDANDIVVAMAPGRVNLIGEYTDFNEGYVLPMTIDRGVYVALRKRTDKRVRVASIRYGNMVEYLLDEFEKPAPGEWPSYVLGVVEELWQRGLLDCGFEAAIDGDLKVGSGLSSSAALEVATAVALQELMGFDMDPVDMVKLCQRVEHTYSNVLCGIMDQFASRMGRERHALLLDCRALSYENVPVELGDHRIIIISSEVRRALASSAYNKRRAECLQAVEYFGRLDSNVSALRDVTADLFEAHGAELSPVVRRRCHHVISEIQRTLDAAAALKTGNLEDFGNLMTASHQSLRAEFEVSCDELDFLVNLAMTTDGVLGSRMTGAGFGGCTVSLAQQDAVPLLVERCASYTARFGLEPGVFVLDSNLEAGPVCIF